MEQQEYRSGWPAERERVPVLASSPTVVNRRSGMERRAATLLGLLYGGFRPRRRTARRADDAGTFLDWHDPSLLLPVLGILVLCIADGVLTLNLLQLGASELNGFMAHLIERDPYLFSSTKMFLTGGGLIFLVVFARHYLFRRVLVQHVLYAFLAAYAVLIAYELVLITQ